MSNGSPSIFVNDAGRGTALCVRSKSALAGKIGLNHLVVGAGVRGPRCGSRPSFPAMPNSNGSRWIWIDCLSQWARRIRLNSWASRSCGIEGADTRMDW